MTNFPQVPARAGSRITLLALIFGGLFLFAVVALPPASRAVLQQSAVKQTTGSVPGKRLRSKFVPGHVLVRYKNEAMAKRQQQTTTALSVKDRSIPIQLERFEASDMVAGLRLAHVAAEDTMTAIQALKAKGDVLYAEPDYIMHADITPNDPCFPLNTLTSCQPTVPPNQIQPISLYGLNKIGAPTAWNTTTGSNAIVVGVIDEGIDVNHPDLHNNIWVNPSPGAVPGFVGDINGWDFLHNDASVFDNTGVYPTDETDSHATHVAGTIGAVGNNGVGVVGVNWTVRLMSLKFLGPPTANNPDGGGSNSDALRAMNYAKAQKDLFVSGGGAQGANVRVLNNSYGGGGFSQAILDGINALNQSGILFVASAGNDGNSLDTQPQYPASYQAPNVIAVAWTDQNDNLHPQSNFGPQSVAVGAPGSSILSTTPSNTYDKFSGTSMASPHVAGSAALLLAQNPNLTVQQLKSLLIFNGDIVPALDGKTITGRRLNVGGSFQALQEADTTPPGAAANFHVNTQSGRSFNLGWTTSGDDAATGQASLYQLSFVDATTGAVIVLKNLVPLPSGMAQNLDVKVPYRHTNGAFRLREFDNVGNEGTPVSLNVSVSLLDGDPYATAVGESVALSTGGTHLNFNCDDCFKTAALPFAFPFFGQPLNSVTISSNGSLYFPPPTPNANDAVSGVVDLSNFKMIAGLWDDLYLKTDQRADADVYMVQPDANRVIFRWQGVPCNDQGAGCAFGGSPVNFEIELRSNGLIQTRFGSGNTNLFPVVGISNGEPDPYVITGDTSEQATISLTNAQQVTYIPRVVMNPADFVDFFVSQHYRDFLSREPDAGGETFWIDQIAGNATNTPAPCANGDAACLNARRINVSNAFFFELEYQQTGSYVYRMYREAFGNNQPFPNPDPTNPAEANKLPLYSKFATDREQVIGGSDLPQQQLALANAFVLRPEFTNRYPGTMTLDQFVDAVLATINDLGANLNSQRDALIALGSRGAVIYRLANDDLQGGNGGINNRLFIDSEYNRAFVFGEYSGYLRRDSDIGGFLFWLNQVNGGPLRDVAKQHGMVCAFMNSDEYQLRFSTIITHNQLRDCQ